MRAIDADALLESMPFDLFWDVVDADMASCAIENAPTLDVEPVRRGKWVQFESETGWGDAFECSVCGVHDAYETRYCPSCGAKMEKP